MQNIKLRKLKDSGILKFHEFLDSLDTDNPESPPVHILNNPDYSDGVSNSFVKKVTFTNKLEMARYLHDLFCDLDYPLVLKDKGIWAWLSLFFFDQLCPKTHGNRYKPGKRYRWVPEISNFQTYYRHLLRGPYLIYNFHKDKPERAMALLSGDIDKLGDLHEQIASRQELITNKSLIEATYTLYYNPKTRSNKKGSGGKGGGSPRRLADIIDQFNLTWDLYFMTPDMILTLLPEEFEKFRKN